MATIKEFQTVKEIYMCKITLERMVDTIHDTFNVELAACEVFDRRWSFILGTENYVTGRYRLKLNGKYGIIVNCEEEKLDAIKVFISQREVIDVQ